MAMTKKPAGIFRHSKTGKPLYREHKSNVFEKIEQVAGYQKYPFDLRTVNNVPLYLGVIRSLKDVETRRRGIENAFKAHKRLIAVDPAIPAKR